MNNIFKNKFSIMRAFTLAEVLITLGIIGVVAAMTLPALKNAIDENVNITRVKKFYSILANATNLIIEQESIPASWNLNNNDNSSEKVLDFYKTQFNMIKTCNSDDTSCFHFPIKSYDGRTDRITESQYKSWKYQGFVLNDGTTCLIDCNVGTYTIFFDVNGNKGPNRLGEDVFSFAINGDGQIVSQLDPSITSGSDNEYDYAWRIMKNNWKKDY